MTFATTRVGRYDPFILTDYTEARLATELETLEVETRTDRRWEKALRVAFGVIREPHSRYVVKLADSLLSRMASRMEQGQHIELATRVSRHLNREGVAMI